MEGLEAAAHYLDIGAAVDLLAVALRVVRCVPM